MTKNVNSKYYMPNIYYLPEQHDFKYVARVPWPKIYTNWQEDWISSIETLEQWLTEYTGPHWVEWAYSQMANQDYWEACVAFKQDRNRTLFLLTCA